MDEDRRTLPRSAGQSQEHWSQHWQRLVAKQEASGLTQAEFCRREGVHLGTFRRWKYQRLKSAGRQADACPPRFLPVEIEDQGARVVAGNGSGVEVLVGDHRLRLSIGFDAETLRRAVEALATPPC